MKCSTEQYEQYKGMLDLYNPYIITLKEHMGIMFK